MRRPLLVLTRSNPVLTCVLGIAHLAAWSGALGAAESARTFALASHRTPGVIDRVDSALEVAGQLKFGQSDKDQKTSVLANLCYDERTLQVPADGNARWRSVRLYDKAAAAIQVGTTTVQPELPAVRRLIAVELQGPTATLFSPQGPLSWDELSLIDVLGNSLSLDRLLPPSPVAIGQSWKHPADVLAALLGVDAVSEHDVQSTLTEVAGETARVEMSGRLSGSVKGASTRIQLKGKYHFDLRTGRITWFGLLVQEDRAASQIEHAFSVVARLQMKISPQGDVPQLADAALAGLPLQPAPECTALAYRSPEAGWEWLQDRRWYVSSEDPGRTVFRLVDKGDYLAQCTVAPVADSAAKDMSMARFQSDIQTLLGKTFKQFVEASEPSNEPGYRIYRVVVRGEVDEVAVQWIYYLVADHRGHQVVFAFSVEADLAGRFGDADEQLLKTVRLTDPKVASKPEGSRADTAK